MHINTHRIQSRGSTHVAYQSANARVSEIPLGVWIHRTARRCKATRQKLARQLGACKAEPRCIGLERWARAKPAQFWSLEHPSSPGYAQRYGIPQENIENANFMETGVLNSNTPFVTRAAPAVGENQGGGIEVVTPPHGVRLKSFCTR